MKILSAKLYNTTSPLSAGKRKFAPVFKGVEPLKTDRAEFNISPEEHALSKINKITKEEYDSLTKDERLLLREKSAAYIKEIIGRDVKEDILVHQNAAEAIKQVYDKQFGKGNYVVVPIGRSMSSIGKMLALKIGEENVKNIPMSAIQRYFTYACDMEKYDGVVKRFASVDGFEQFKRYLASIGLTKEEVEKSGKHYILMDYTASSKSLHAAYTVLTSDYLLGNEKGNIHKVSDRRVLYPVKNENPYLAQLDSLLDQSAFKNYSLVSSVYNDFMNIEKAADYHKMCKDNPILLRIKKYFGFALLDSEFSERSKPACHFEIVPMKDRLENGTGGLRNQDKKIWHSSDSQFVEDIDNDSHELCKLLTRLEKPLQKLSIAKSKYEYSSREEIETLSRKIEKEIQEKFPFEYKYYNNRKSFEKLILGKSDKEKYKPYIYQEVKGFEKESKLYKFFEEFDRKSDSIFKGKFEDSKESKFTDIKKAQSLLLQCAQDIKPFQKCVYNTDYICESFHFSNREKQLESVKIMQKFYDEIHQRINENFRDISQKYTPAKCNEYIEMIDTEYKNAVIERDEKNKALLSQLLEKLSDIKISHNQYDLRLALEKQNAALKKAYDTMLPF